MSGSRAKLEDGALAKCGALSPSSIEKATELLSTIKKSNVETIRVLFADQHGVLRGKTIVRDAMESAFFSGIAAPSTLLLKDTAHKTVFPVWSDNPGVEGMAGAGDLLMVPDPDTFRILPWSPHSAWIFCDARYKSGDVISFSPRDLLKKAITKLARKKMALVVGLEIEFHIFQCLDPMLSHADATMPAQPPKTQNLNQGYQFLTETHYATLEPVMDELRRHCQALGLPIRSMEVEMGPSQFEFTFDPADPLTHADNMVMFRTMVKEVCAKQGLHATFMCKPKVENACASGWHLHQSVICTDTGNNLLQPDSSGAVSNVASGWIAGLLAHAEESCLLTTPTVNGYKRYQAHQLAPDRIQWGRDNRGAMIRALMSPEDSASRIENRVAETTANPYYFFASQILSGLDGIESNLCLPDAVETPYDSDARRLPGSLISAIQLFSTSSFYRKALGDEFVDYLVRVKQAEWNRYHQAISEWEQAEYFSLY